MIPKIKLFCLLIVGLPLLSSAQENSPYSRYGIGNIVPEGNILNRGMGGISAAFTDPVTINNVNPAAYSSIVYTTLDVGVEYDGRVIKSQNPLGDFKSKNGIISYLQLAFPLLSGNLKAQKNKTSWGLSFGLKPVSKINYKISSVTRTSIDSIGSIYEGSGGVNEAFVGTGLKIKNFSIGFNTGYLFGEKDYDTKLAFIDSVEYYKAEYATKTRFGGMFLNAGFQWAFKIKNGFLRFGGYGTARKKYAATRDYSVQTFDYDVNTGSVNKIDSVYETTGEKGNVELPSTIGGGIVLEKEHFLVGADYEVTNWDSYRFFGQRDLVKNSWMGKFGFQYFPSPEGSPKYFNNVKYRAGLSFGQDYIDVDSKLPVYTISVGGSFPLKVRHSFYDYQYSFLNLSLEYGTRGNSSNNIKENTFRVGVGFSLSDRNWFVRRKFD